MFLTLFVFMKFFLYVSSKYIPSFVHVCRRNDPELNQCVINTFNEIRPYLANGLPEMGIPPGEPLRNIKATTNTGMGTSVNLEIEAWNATAMGLMGANITNLNLDLDRPFCKIAVTFPYLSFHGLYKFKGKILFIEVDASDQFSINATAVDATADIFDVFHTRAGKKYVEFKTMDLKVGVGKTAVYFHDLINNNQALTETADNAASFVHLCKRNDPELSKCFMRSVNEIRPYLLKGIPEMDLPPGDPLDFYSASANTGKGTAVTLEAEAWNQTATGLMKFELQDLHLDLDNASCTATVLFPHVRLQGQYKFKGKVMLFEIDTSGLFDINATEVHANAKWIGKFHMKDRKEHIEFEKIHLKLNIKKSTTVYFTNLLNGNEALTETLNQAVNENINVILDELYPVLEDTLGGIARRYFNQVFRLFSVDQLFPRN